MIRLFWIVGLSIALSMFSGSVIVCLVALITHRYTNLSGWTMLVAAVYAVKAMYSFLRSAILYGDPTKSENRKTNGSPTAGPDTANPFSR